MIYLLKSRNLVLPDLNIDRLMELTEIKAGKTGHGLLIERDGGIKGDTDTVKQIREDIEKHDKFVIPDHFVVSAVFQKYGIKNANRRIYPEDILKPAVEEYLKTKVHGFGNAAIGALDHPLNSSALSLHDVTHKILDLKWVNNTLIGEMELHLSPGYRRYGICSTSGDLAANLILDNILIGVSSRGVGDVQEKYGDYIVSEYELISWDVVAEPSTPNAFIDFEMSNLEQFIESDSTKDEKKSINEKMEHISKLLL